MHPRCAQPGAALSSGSPPHPLPPQPLDPPGLEPHAGCCSRFSLPSPPLNPVTSRPRIQCGRGPGGWRQARAGHGQLSGGLGPLSGLTRCQTQTQIEGFRRPGGLPRREDRGIPARLSAACRKAQRAAPTVIYGVGETSETPAAAEKGRSEAGGPTAAGRDAPAARQARVPHGARVPRGSREGVTHQGALSCHRDPGQTPGRPRAPARRRAHSPGPQAPPARTERTGTQVPGVRGRRHLVCGARGQGQLSSLAVLCPGPS